MHLYCQTIDFIILIALYRALFICLHNEKLFQLIPLFDEASISKTRFTI